jgi:thymidylate synthase (FAD)
MELSAKGKVVIQKLIKGQKCDLENSNLSKREWNELMESFGFKEKIL